MTDKRKRVAIVGARRRRQGIGEFVARSFDEAGASVVAIVGTTVETVDQARSQLADAYGIDANPYFSIRRLLDFEEIDILALCTPYRFHREQLEAIGPAGVHCLCEKPLWWGPTHDLKGETEALLDPFVSAEKTFGLITQWPCTIAGFFELHPEQRGEPLETFEMLLSPISGGTPMVLDSMPHVLSMLREFEGPGRIDEIEGSFTGRDNENLAMSFSYHHRRGRARVSVRFARKDEPPRPAAYAVNGCGISREISLPEYTMSLVAEDRTVSIEDPLLDLVKDFITRVERNDPTDRDGITADLLNLQLLTSAAERWEKRRF
jgi:hypothetical protein